MKFSRFARLRLLSKKRQLPLRIRLALWSAGLVLLLSFGLLFFINIVARESFHSVILYHLAASGKALPLLPADKVDRPFIELPIPGLENWRPRNPLEGALLVALQNISLIGMGLVALLSGIGAYCLSGIALRPLRKVSEATRLIGVNTLHTRLNIAGPTDEVKELADTFDAMLERLEGTFEQQGRFVADIAHELRTPLTSMRTNLEVITSDPDTTLDDYREMAAAQERALTRLERLVADLLILATSEQPLTYDKVSLGPLLEDLFADLKHLSETRGITLTLINNAEVVVQGKGLLLARVFSNLIENGIHYNHPGGNVTVTIDSKDSFAVMTVADTGVGIPTENQLQVFDRFYRIDTSRARHKGGAGLGLSIVSALVRQHGGRVQVESTPGVGSTFTILLPLQQITLL